MIPIDPEEKQLELRKLKIQRSQVVVSLLGPLIAVFVLWFSIRGDLAAAREAAEREAVQVAAETGERLCVPNMEGDDELLTSNILAQLDLDTFCEKFSARAPSYSVQRELIAQLVDHPKEREFIISMWKVVYEEDAWIDQIEEGV